MSLPPGARRLFPDRAGSLLIARLLELLPRLAARPWAEELYLAGSAALALHTGHRLVSDLDLMSNANRLPPPERRDVLAELLALDLATEDEAYLFARQGGGAAVLLLSLPARPDLRGKSPGSPSPPPWIWD